MSFEKLKQDNLNRFLINRILGITIMYMNKTTLLLFFLLLYFTPSAFSQKHTAIENKVIAYIDQHMPDAMNLLKESVNINLSLIHI